MKKRKIKDRKNKWIKKQMRKSTKGVYKIKVMCKLKYGVGRK